MIKTLNFFRCFFKTGNPKDSHPAVPFEDVLWLDDLRKTDEATISFESALYLLRRKLFPFMHNPHPWVEGTVQFVFLTC